jgi:hypothetical protein
MWALSLLTFFLSLTPWIRHYKIEPPTLAIANTLLFALPALRDSQPGIPLIGCTADVVSFFWCEMLTALSSCLMLLNYVYFTHRPPVSKKEKAEVERMEAEVKAFVLRRESTRRSKFVDGKIA